MGRIKKSLWLTFVLFFIAVPVALPQSQQESEQVTIVGRISHVDGELLRYVPDEKDWVATIEDAPFGLDDALYSDKDARAEIIIPNNTWLRIDGSTQVQAIALDEDVTEVDVGSGIARFYNKSSNTVIKATTPFGYVVAEAGAIFDVYVGEESIEVLSLKGSVNYVHDADNAKYEVIAGSSSVIADSRTVTSGEGNVDADWDSWNDTRDDLWGKRLQVKGDSVRYLPPQLEDDSYALEENGEWESVEYEGERRRLWRPTRVSSGWSPYSVGRWTTYHGDQCWVPNEPFGYVTHHYGSWVYVDSSRYWYWAPPVYRPVAVVAARPVVSIGFGWYPGRVSWIHTQDHIGWVPLAPYEPYYSHYRWGPRSVVVGSVNVGNVNINIGNYRYVNHAIVIGHRDLYRVPNYTSVRVTNINHTTIINNYRPAPIINNHVVRNYSHIRERYNFRNVEVRQKPHRIVIDRIDRNQRISQRQQRVRAADIEQNIRRVKVARPVESARIEKPRVRNKLVPQDKINAPVSEVKFQEKPIKAREKARPVKSEIGPRGPQRGPDAPERELKPREQQRLDRQQRLEERKLQLEEKRQERRGGRQGLEQGQEPQSPSEERPKRRELQRERKEQRELEQGQGPQNPSEERQQRRQLQREQRQQRELEQPREPQMQNEERQQRRQLQREQRQQRELEQPREPQMQNEERQQRRQLQREQRQQRELEQPREPQMQNEERQQRRQLQREQRQQRELEQAPTPQSRIDSQERRMQRRQEMSPQRADEGLSQQNRMMERQERQERRQMREAAGRESQPNAEQQMRRQNAQREQGQQGERRKRRAAEEEQQQQ